MTDKQLFKLIMNDESKEKLIYSLGREVQQLEKEVRQLKYNERGYNNKINELEIINNQLKAIIEEMHNMTEGIYL